MSVKPELLSQLGFRFVIRKLPNVNYYCQEVTIPEIGITHSTQGTPFASIKRPGDKVTFGDLTIQFKVDEDLANYKEIFNWLVGLGHPESFDQTRALSKAAIPTPFKTGAASSFVSDASVIILSAMKNSTHQFTFRDLFPIGLSISKFDSRDNNVNYVTATATFAYQQFTIEEIS
jgi:hypothetical protein